jgi:hypothetical protein
MWVSRLYLRDDIRCGCRGFSGCGFSGFAALAALLDVGVAALSADHIPNPLFFIW